MSAWANRYVGLPWRVHGRDRGGVDCWGLIRLVYAEQLGIDLPAYDDGYDGAGRKDLETIAGLISPNLPAWCVVSKRTSAAEVTQLGKERPLDVLLLRMIGLPSHVAVVSGGGAMLHVEEGVDSVIETYDDFRWRRRIEAIYRHPSLMPAAGLA